MGNAANVVMPIFILNNPMAPKVQMMPRIITGMGSRGHRTCLKKKSRARIISTPQRARILPLVLFMVSISAAWKEGSPVMVMP